MDFDLNEVVDGTELFEEDVDVNDVGSNFENHINAEMT